MRRFAELLDMRLYSGNEQFIIRGVPLVDSVAGHKAAFRLVDSHLVAELSSFGQLTFLNRSCFRVKETDDPICDDSIAGNDLFGLFQQLAG
ncbi:hypothetical protein D3C76_1418280 [compost metagenome]